MSSGSSGIFSKFFISSDPGVLKWLLIVGGVAFIGIGLLLNVLFPEIVCPKGLYFPLGMASVWLGVLASTVKHIKKYLFEYAFWVYVAMYLFVIFISYSNNLQLGFSLVLIAVHILFSVSFRTMTEYTVFAIASLLFYSVCTFFRPNLQISPLLFLSVICGISLFAGIYVWMREHRYDDLVGGGELLVSMLDNSAYAIFLLELDKGEIIYTNQMAKQMLLNLRGETQLNMKELLRFLGLEHQFLEKRYAKLPINELESSSYTIEGNPGKPMELELRIGRISGGPGSPLLVKARDISYN
ncbi:MAG: hypothetical protein AAF696_35940, partial [Bacteroidota bacterium]